MPADRSNAVTVIAIAAIAYALADLVHEGLGHGLVSVFVPGVKATFISTVQLREIGESRVVSASGTIANIVVGGASLRLFAVRRTSVSSYCLWLFAAVNLMNVGYLAYSGLTNSGDWSDVIAGLPMHPLWRAVLIVAGCGGYAGAMRLLSATMTSQISRSSLDLHDIRRVIIVSYVSGSVLILLGSALNPDKQMILLSGLPEGFLSTIGLLPVAASLVDNTTGEVTRSAIGFSATWILCGAIVAAVFVLIFGPGVPL
jgi:hypothetical protein